MKRSEINRLIGEALHFFDEMHFKLPPWGTWSLQKWQKCQSGCEEIFRNRLGWDLTDFGSGDFHASGLLLPALAESFAGFIPSPI